jgi:hypothetical protein
MVQHPRDKPSLTWSTSHDNLSRNRMPPPMHLLSASALAFSITKSTACPQKAVSTPHIFLSTNRCSHKNRLRFQSLSSPIPTNVLYFCRPSSSPYRVAQDSTQIPGSRARDTRILHACRIIAYLGNHIFPEFFTLPPLPLISSIQSPKLPDDLQTANSTLSRE